MESRQLQYYIFCWETGYGTPFEIKDTVSLNIEKQSN